MVRDAVADGGPLAGLAAGLAAARGRLAILVGGDQPSLSPAVLGELLLWLGREATGHRSTRWRSRRTGCCGRCPRRCAWPPRARSSWRSSTARSRSLLGLFERLRVGTLEPERWRVLDPDGASLRDVDTPDDLPGR